MNATVAQLVLAFEAARSACAPESVLVAINIKIALVDDTVRLTADQKRTYGRELVQLAARPDYTRYQEALSREEK